jgi:predicted esterase
MFQAAEPHGGLFVLSGALIGPRGTLRDTPNSFDRMPVFIGASDVDPWVPYDLIEETVRVFRAMGAEVDLRTYPGMAHTVSEDELEVVRDVIAAVSSKAPQ